MRILTSTTGPPGSVAVLRFIAVQLLIIAATIEQPSLGQPANTSAPAVQAADSSSANVLSGRDLYLQQYCGLCHALRKAETEGIFGPAHDGMEELARQRLADPNYSGHASTTVEYVRESILKPQIYIVPGFEATVHRMPAYTHLAPEVIEALVAYLLEPECSDDDCQESESASRSMH
ncbi:MAG: cytochrome c [Rhodothermales bacterium]|nr:cytochrome c [Rhodothermales bacterium]